VAEILHQSGEIETCTKEKLGFGYRSSVLKAKQSPAAIVLSAVLCLEYSSPEAVQERIDALIAHRRLTQPPGASMGSMFRNPPGDYAGRLIESVGLKGTRIGDAEISSQHANFFINLGQATASELYSLIKFTQNKVLEQTGVRLELEIELLGEW
jgi:UDP-N-acetylmuramate dehydrogenase